MGMAHLPFRQNPGAHLRSTLGKGVAIVSLVLLALSAVGCGELNAPTTRAAEGSPVVSSRISTDSSTPTAVPQVASTVSATITARPTGAAARTPVTSEPLTLGVMEPEDGIAVDSPEIQVIGKATGDVVVSVNGELADLDSGGRFEMTVTLEEGLNNIEVIASDSQGTEVRKTITAVYVP